MADSKRTVKECVDCGRIMSIVARGLCGKCFNRHKKIGDLDELYPSKHDKKRKFTEQPAIEEKPGSPKIAPPEEQTLVAESSPKKTDNSICEITVRFMLEDADLEQEIKASAKYHRRSLSQEILFRLEHGAEA